MELAGQYGIKPGEFWSLSPREFAAWKRGQDKRGKIDMARAHYTAWVTANYSRTKRLPPLEKVLRKIVGAPRREQTPAESLRIAEQLNRMMGGKDLRHLRKVKGDKKG
jgi:hypothetical protein